MSAEGREFPERKDEPGTRSTASAAMTLARCSTAEARAVMPFEVASQLGILPLGILRIKTGDLLTAAFHEGDARELETAVRFATNIRPKLIKVPRDELERALVIAYHGSDDVLEGRVQALRYAHATMGARSSDLPTVPRSEAEVPRFVDALLAYAAASRASDVHITPSRSGSQVSIRVDGEVRERDGSIASRDQHDQIVRRIKILARLDVNERETPQDGRFLSRLGPRTVTVRVSVVPVLHGERVVLRLALEDDGITLSELGFDARTHEALDGLLAKQEGALLLAGSTGSGKTTTLYAVLDALRGKGLTLSSIEDPVEREIGGVSQTSLHTAKGLGYAELLPAILRQDPDVIMIGELRDGPSAVTALQAAITGHLLLATIHARSVFDVVSRLEHFGVSRAQIADAAELLVTQRLLGRLCSSCRVTDLALSHRFGFEAFRAVGCARCHYTGNVGRALVAESLSIDASVRDALLSSDYSVRALQAACTERNYSSFKGSVLSLARSGIVAATSIEAFEIP